jgi:hypothetical protein
VGGLDANVFTRVGDLGQTILGSLPADARAQVEPFIAAIVAAIYRAFSMATANTFTVGIVTALLAAGLVLLLREAPMRATDTATVESSAMAGDQGSLVA